ncbi:hypothetical protein [Enterovibrio coralii]|uniref:Uncharacterized protein n=1 Tax=Enterovibrio coralii TaxID=294935 RepID=A0A135I5I4_9GAMM|nr:hypothetical protein [Enterovibrio coralii]KXF80709.1 hypothetical protein ATN88_08755 [Enterovibrio coralii]
MSNGNITYRRNDDVLRETTYSGETPDFYVDSSFYNGAIRLTDIKLTPASGSGFAVDADNDGVANDLDLDSDNDTIPDVVEAGLADADGDLMVDQNNLQGTVNPAPDSDGDGIPDYLDLESNNPENDGTAFDMHGYDFAAFDTNGDGMLTQQDGEGGADVNGNGVDDRAEDSDGDGISNPNDEDDDNDGTLDIYDAFPFDPNEDTDTDGDGVGDNADAFPTDDTETKDTDGDGVGDNSDVFPEDAYETKDTDGDGVGDNADDFPNDANETTDADMDGVGDNADIDRDNDGLSDELELRTEAAITDWPVLYGSSYSNGELSANGGSWTYQANSKRFSEYGYRDNYRLSFTVAGPGTYNMFGLGNAESSASYTDIDYAFYIAGSYIYIYESGTSRSWFAQIAVGDVLSIEVNNGSIAYYHNQDLLRSVTYSGETPDFYVDTSFYSGAIRLTDIKLTPASGAVLNTDADSDGYANDRDLDSDNDTIPDIVEAGLTDRDGDMQVDYIFQQGIVSPAPDSDGDGIPDFLDLESLNAANDGTDYDMHRFIYAQYDTNGDGMLNQQDGEGGADTNNNGVDDRAEDADRDGVLNGNDDDDDNDGTRDLDDALPFDPNETRDSDGDGVGDNADAFPNDDSESKDTDGDGVGNNVDLDNDNDGVSDLVESHADVAITRWPVLVGNARYGDGKLSANGGSWTHQANSDRFSTFGFRRDYQFSFVLNQLGTYNMVGLGDQETSASYTDIDFAFYFVGSTIYIYENGSSRGTFGTATVGDTFAIKVSDTGISYLQNGNVLREVNIAQTEVDYYVDTSFYSGAFEIGNMKLSRLSTTSLSDDMDGDGIPNALDLDSDNDAIPDLIEVGLPDANGDLKVDTADLEGSVTAPQDSDNDGIPDYLDLESLNPANDGTAYDIDNSGYSFFDTNGDGMLDGTDEFGADGNGNGMADIAEAAGS